MFSYFNVIWIVIVINLIVSDVEANNTKKLKALHLTFHKGCERELAAISEALSIEIKTWFIPDLPINFFDGVAHGNALYNIGHERAERIWNLHKDYFDQFDVIITSDTAPLARIFLQNGFKKPLIIWICNRFDYSDQASSDCAFPDPEYYYLISAAHQLPNVTIVAYTAFEHYYAKTKGVDTGNLVISPSSLNSQTDDLYNFHSAIPKEIVKEECFFLPPYHNEIYFMNLPQKCFSLQIPTFRGRYNGAYDLKDFKGIIHLPYAWSNLALFENMTLGIPYFIPSHSFFRELILEGNYFFHPNITELLKKGILELSEWYSSEHQEIFTYFDSWEDLQVKIRTTDLLSLREKIKQHAQQHQIRMIEKWKNVFNSITKKE